MTSLRGPSLDSRESLFLSCTRRNRRVGLLLWHAHLLNCSRAFPESGVSRIDPTGRAWKHPSGLDRDLRMVMSGSPGHASLNPLQLRTFQSVRGRVALG